MGDLTRQDLWKLIRGISDQMHALEEAAADQNFAVEAGDRSAGLQLVDLEQARRDTREVLARLRDFLAGGATL